MILTLEILKIDDLIIFQREGQTYIRRQRIDEINRKLRSPAREETIENFKRAAALVRGKYQGEFVYLPDGRRIQKRMFVLGQLLRSQRIYTQHVNRRRELILSLWDQLGRTGSTLVSIGNKIVAVIRD